MTSYLLRHPAEVKVKQSGDETSLSGRDRNAAVQGVAQQWTVSIQHEHKKADTDEQRLYKLADKTGNNDFHERDVVVQS